MAKARAIVKRRKSVQDSLKDLDEKQKSKDKNIKKPPLKVQIRQAGMTVPVERFYIYSVICGAVLTFGAFFLGAPTLVLPGAFIAGTLGLPRWFVSFRRGRRVKAFLNEFPNALDIIVRAVKSGLPLNDGIRLIASESPEPVRSEFRRIVESQQIGMSIPDATLRMPETMPCPEASFFGIVIQIQSQAGGNLSEALSNLSTVLRDRFMLNGRPYVLRMVLDHGYWPDTLLAPPSDEATASLAITPRRRRLGWGGLSGVIFRCTALYSESSGTLRQERRGAFRAAKHPKRDNAAVTRW